MSQTQTALHNTQDAPFDDDLSFLDDLDEIIEEEAGADDFEEGEATLIEDSADENLLMSVVSEIESEEEMIEIYAGQNAEVVAVEVAVVDGDSPVIVMSPEESVGAVAEAEAPAVVGKTKEARVAKSGKLSERIFGKAGANAIDETTLSVAWASKTEQQHREDFANIVDNMALYVGDKAANLFTFMRTGGGLNAVTLRGFQVLIRDGQLVGGDQGNIVTNLLSKPYSLGTARSQSNQLLQLFTDLEIGTRASKGTVVINPNSIILERVKTLIGK